MNLQKILFIIFLFYQACSFDVYVTSTNNFVSGTANHVFLFEGVGDFIYANTYIQIQYDPIWTFTSSTSGGDLTKDYCDTGCTMASVAYTNTTNKIKINGLFPNQILLTNYAVKYTIKNIINPNKVYTQNFVINLFMSDGTLYSFGATSLSVFPSIMTCTGTPTNKQISNITSYTFTVNPSTSLPSTGYLIANFPSQWSDSSQSNVFQSINCSNALNTINCSNITSSSIKLVNLISTSGTSPFNFIVGGIRNPAHTLVTQQLYFSYFNSFNQLISRCSIQISGLTSKSLQSVSFDLICNTSSTAIGFLNFTVIQKPKITDKMVLTLPSQIYPSDLIKVLISTGTDPGILNKQISIQSSSSSNTKISFYPFKTQVITNFKVEIYNLKCPSTIKQTNNISIDIIRMGSVIATYQCCNITSTLPQFQTASVTCQNDRTAQITNYRFFIKLNQTIGLGTSYIDFIFPSSYNLVVGNIYSCYIQGLTLPSNTLCRVETSTQISLSLVSGNFSLIMSNLKSINIATSFQMYVVLIAIQNPSSLSASFNIYLADTNHNYLQGKTGIILALTPSLISGISIVPWSYQVYALTTYTFRINNTNFLPANSLLRIKFPSQIKLQTPITKINGSLTNNITTLNGTQYQILITLPNTILNQYNLYSYIITIDNVRNPQSFQITDSFSIQLQSGGTVLQSISGSQSISMNQTNIFSSLSISIPSNTVLQHTEYTINYNFAMNYNSSKNYQLKVTFPSDYKVYGCLSCNSFGQLSLNSNTGFVKISDVQNPSKTTISSNILVELYIDNFLSLQSTYLISSFTSIVQDFDVNFSNNIMGQSAIYWIIGKNLKQQMKQIRIQLPSQITISNLSITCQQCQISSFNEVSKLIKIMVNKLEDSNATFKITGINNPKIYPSSIFTFSTYSSDSILISQSTTNKNFFNITCSPSCSTCDSINTSKCLTCYQDPAINNLKYLDVSSNICRSACTTAQYLIGIICYPCSIQCNTCSLQANNCTSCSGLTYLFNNTCLNTCPQLYYGQTNICQSCVPPCLRCSSSLICTYCISGKVLRPDGSCQDTCASSYYNKSNICVLCTSNCLLCNLTGCISCLPSFYLINASCVNKCPFGYFIDSNSLNCQVCQSPCKYCEGKSTNCTGCDTTSVNKYYLNNQCIGACLNTYYPDQYFICRPCISPCSNCNSQTNCTSCANGYLYYSSTNQCFSSCINKTIQIGSQCVECQSNCLECSISASNCTSCIQNYFLDQTLNKCNLTCNSPYKAIDRICRSCASPCAQCLPNQPYKCLTCILGYKLLNNNCFSTCPPTTYSTSGQCMSCTSGCYECSTSSSTCTSCYPGTYLHMSSCIPNCPLTPIYYYQYQSQCISCQSPCLTCLTSPIQCQTCISNLYYWNPITLECKLSCVNPYFSVNINGTNQCKKCQVPCKTCSTTYNKCTSCISGTYLNQQQCLNSCPQLYYMDNGTCLLCPSLCFSCTKYKCITCKAGNLLYKQLCYSSCPPQAPYVHDKYCRNCLKQNCLYCNTNNECVMCFQNYYLLNSQCYSICPTDYQPDSLTNLACVKSSQKALFEYLKIKQKLKIFLFPGLIITFLVMMSVLIFPGKKQVGLFSLLSIAQNLTTIILIYFYVKYGNEDLVINFTIPSILVILIYSLEIGISCFYSYKARKQYMRDQAFQLWYQFGSNQKRTNLIFILSIFNLKLLKLLFSGFLKLPFTSYQFKDKDKLKYLNWVVGLFVAVYTLPLIGIALYMTLVQKVYLTNNKLFFSAIDSAVVQVISLIVSLIYLNKEPQLPQRYKKNIIQGITNMSIYPLSEPNQYIGDQEENDIHLYHSNSVQDIKKSEQMKQVQFKSVYDPSDFQDPPFIQPDELENALKKGKFRTKQKPKKKGKGKYKLDQLQVIEEQISDQQQKINEKRRKFKNNKKQSFVNNFIYWQPPKQKKNRAQQVFKQNKREIMKKIYQKQSEFDTITNNDIIFLQQSDQQSQRRKKQNSDNYQESQNNQSKRQLNQKIKNQVSTLFNLNYAKRKHLQ